mgnify:CR=1 FL=1
MSRKIDIHINEMSNLRQIPNILGRMEYMENELYVVKDVPQYSEDVSNYCYVVKATSHNEAIEIVKSKTGHNWK